MLIKNLLQKKPISLLTMAYMIALTLIAGMSVGAHLVVKRVIAEQEESARKINIAGRQRMLSQRTALFMTNAVAGDKIEAQNKLLESINLLERSHNALTKGNADMGLKGTLSQNLRDIYYREPYNLDQSVKQYIQDVRTILSDVNNNLTKESQVFQRAKILAEGQLLKNLDIAVKAYEEDADKKIDRLVEIQGFAITVILIVIVLEGVVIFRPLIIRVREYSDNIEEIARIDSLTGVLNRRSIFDVANNELGRAKRYEHDLALIICDIDHFKKVNDTYGHQVGDEALKHFTQLIEKVIRKEDILGRIGGEEFLILLPHTNKENANVVAEKLRSTIEQYPLAFKDKGEDTKLPMTASFGLTMFNKFTDTDSDDLYNRADEALYVAKESGRNRIEEK